MAPLSQKKGVSAGDEKRLVEPSSRVPTPLEASVPPTREDMMRSGLLKWMDEFSGLTHANCLSVESLTSNDEVLRFIDTLDQQCERQLSPLDSRVTAADSQRPSLSVPTVFPFLLPHNECLRTGANRFAERLAKTVHGKDFQKQMDFQAALLDMQQVLSQCPLPFFLACGSALGVHRENKFIAHDYDVDIGINVQDVVQLGKLHGRTGFTVLPSSLGSEVEWSLDAERGVIEMMRQMSTSGIFVIFDLCGTPSKGMEVRLLHLKTNVRVDVNLYYPPIENDDNDLVRLRGPFVWTATHYENSGAMKHGMYRYFHLPFYHNLETVEFCAKDGETFLVPPVSYVVECFGDDWTVPKVFSYAEGLHNKEYRNIIDE